MIFSGLNRLHVDGDFAWDLHTKIGSAARHVRDVGAGHQRFGRRTAGVNASPSKEFALDHRYGVPRRCKAMCERGARLSSSDDDGIVGLHWVTCRSFRGLGVVALFRGFQYLEPRLVQDHAFVRIEIAIPGCLFERPHCLGVAGLPTHTDAGGTKIDVLGVVLVLELWC